MMQLIVGFFLGFCTSVVIEVIHQRTGIVGGEALLLPMIIGLSVMMYRMGKEYR